VTGDVARILRLGAVSYLNVRPLVDGLDAIPDRVRLRFDVPSLCARLLEDGAIDLGMVPSITHTDRPGDRIVPGVCIGSEGPVASVAIFARVPVARIRSLALDTSSRTSVALARILCARRWACDPALIPHAPDLASMLAVADAAVLIGDPALFADPVSPSVEKIDLGAAWTEMTGLPFVWAFWAGRAGAVDPDHVALLQSAARRGTARSDAIAAKYCAGEPGRIPLAQRYLRENMRFDLDDRALAGLRTYYREAAGLGLAAERASLEFFAAPVAAPEAR
jgi:chorismate dehydratase